VSGVDVFGLVVMSCLVLFLVAVVVFMSDPWDHP
jgi:hypothetical protein